MSAGASSDRRARYAKEAAVAALCALASTSIALVALRAWRGDIDVPLRYSDDANLNLMFIKGLLENGWYTPNDALGAPLGQSLNDYPVLAADHLNVLLLLAIGQFISGPAAVLNVFYYLTFFLASLSSYVAFRLLSLSRLLAVTCACLFALLPYHFLRGETHFLLSAYYAVPIGVFFVIAVMTGRPLFRLREGARGIRRLATSRTAGAVIACVLVATAGGSFYYSAFTVLLVLAAVIVRLVATRDIRSTPAGLIVALIIVGVSAANAAPSIAYRIEHGANDTAVQRQPFESEYYSLRLSQLMLPLADHRLDALARARQRYDAWAGSTGLPVTEAGLATLGSAATIGLVAAVLAAFGAALRRSRSDLTLVAAGIASLIAFIVATMGGGSSLISLFVYSELRAWNRLSIFIACFSLLAFGIVLDRLRTLLQNRSRIAGRAVAVAIVAVIGLGALDQTTNAFIPDYDGLARAYRTDADFAKRVEARLPDGTLVFQYPHAPFPESIPPPPGRSVVYEYVRPYLHSKRLRWSFGAMSGRSADWASRLQGQPIAKILEDASALGFGAFYVNVNGFDDDESAQRAVLEIARRVGTQPVRSADGRELVFDMGRFNARFHETHTAVEIEALRRATLEA